MQDFNFFSSFLLEQKKEKKKNSLNMYSIIALIILLAILMSAAFNFIRLKQIQSTINDSDAFLNDPDNLAKLEEVDQITAEITKIEGDFNVLSSLNGQIQNERSVIVNVLDFMNEQVTEDMYFEDLGISNRQISVVGMALTRLEVAQFEYNVRNSGYFDQIFVESISKQEREDIDNVSVYASGRYTQRFNAFFVAKDAIYESMGINAYVQDEEDIEDQDMDSTLDQNMEEEAVNE